MNHHPIHQKEYLPRLIAWEVTRRCNLKCQHCRAQACDKEYEGEFSTEECFKLLDNIASFAKPIIILTGGEPMFRKDIYEISKYGKSLGLKMVMAPCGQFITKENVQKIKESGIERISLSIDGSTKETHDQFRQVEGAFESVINAAKIAKENELEFQVNTTITKHNYKQLDDIFNLAIKMGAVSYHPFLLVPTGRGKDLAQFEISPKEYEEVLVWIYKKSLSTPIHLKPTCAPHYYRIFRQKEKEAGRPVSVETHGMNAMSKGCMGGQSFAFISHIGKVQICGFLEDEAGDIREQKYNFKKIWNESNLFQEMRDIDNYHGRCGICEYRKVCGGCRARSFATTGNYLDEEPYCIYEPNVLKKND